MLSGQEMDWAYSTAPVAYTKTELHNSVTVITFFQFQHDEKLSSIYLLNIWEFVYFVCGLSRLFYANCIGYQWASELLSRQPYWYTNVGMAWLCHTCWHTASQRHHTAVGVTCALLSPVNSLFHVRGQTTETAILPFTGQSCGTVFQPISVCWTFHCRCSGNDWKCSCSRITVIVQRLTWRICCMAKFAPYKCH